MTMILKTSQSSVNDLNAEQKHALRNIEAAVRIWTQLSEHGKNPDAGDRLDQLLKKHKNFCASVGLASEAA